MSYSKLLALWLKESRTVYQQANHGAEPMRAECYIFWNTTVM